MPQEQLSKEEIRELISQNEIKEAITHLKMLFKGTPELKDVELLSSKFHDTKRKSELKTISHDNAEISNNQVKYGLLELLEDSDISEPISDTSKLPHALTPNPFSPPGFLGREEELKDLHQKLFSGKNFLLLVNGKGGMGKTSLASEYYRRYANEYRHVAWVLSEKSIADALLTLSLIFDLDFSKGNLPIEQRLQILLSKLANLNKPCLLVIDNVNEPEDLTDNFKALRQCANFHLLLTTRITEFDDANFFPVGGLKEEFAIELFKNNFEKHDEKEDELLTEIIAAVENNTLIIELLAKNLNATNKLKDYSLSELFADIQKNLLQLSQSKKVKTGYQAPGNAFRNETPETIVAAMYDVKELSESEQKMISVFAVLPNEEIPYKDLKLLLPDEDFDEAVLLLAQKGWIDFNEEEKSFKVNQVVQDVVKMKQRPRLLADLSPAITKLANELFREDLLHKDNYEFSLTLIRYGESVIYGLEKPDDDLATLCQNIGNFHTNTGDLIKAMDSYQKMEKLYKALISDEPDNPDFKNGLAVSYSKLGSTHSSLGNLEKALSFFEDQTVLFEELYESSPQNVSFKNGLAISYNYLGNSYSSMGNLEEALINYEKYNLLSKELFKENPQNVKFKNDYAISYSKLGSTHSSLGNLEKALTFYEKDLQLTKELYESYPKNVSFKNGLAISYSKLGETHSSLGNLEKALTFFEDETVLFEELYEAYPQNVSFKNGLAISYEKLGSTHSSLGNLEKALTFFEDYNKLKEELYEAYPQNVSFKNGLAISYEKLGSTHSSLGNLEKALTFFEERSRLGKELYESYPQNVEFKNNLAISYYKLGHVNQKLSNQSLYFENLKKAEAIWIELVKDAPQYAQFKEYLGIVQKELSEK